MSKARYGAGASWLLYFQRYSFVGITGRVELTSTITVAALSFLFESAAALLEFGLAQEPGGDDEVVLLDGSVIAYFNSSEGRAYLGLGTGFARWEDKRGWDRGVWYQNFSKFIIGGEFSYASLSFFVQASLTFGSWFNPVMTAGMWF